MGGMMTTAGAGYPWTLVLLWTLLGLAVVVTSGVVVAKVLSSRPDAGPGHVRAAGSPGLQEAQDALRLRYARGEISREDYLQGKVELQD
jgi:putative membrane protein